MADPAAPAVAGDRIEVVPVDAAGVVTRLYQRHRRRLHKPENIHGLRQPTVTTGAACGTVNTSATSPRCPVTSAATSAPPVECNGHDNHLYLPTEYPPTVPISRLVNFRKRRPDAQAPPAIPGVPPRAPMVPSNFTASCGVRHWLSSSTTWSSSGHRAANPSPNAGLAPPKFRSGGRGGDKDSRCAGRRS